VNTSGAVFLGYARPPSRGIYVTLPARSPRDVVIPDRESSTWRLAVAVYGVERVVRICVHRSAASAGRG